MAPAHWACPSPCTRPAQARSPSSTAQGSSYSMSPLLEARRASQLGVIQLGELLEAGVKVSLSTDHIASTSCDPFSSMRILFALHLHRIGVKVPLTLKRLLQFVTLDGAVDLGI